MATNKLKIFNDPIYGFIHINDERIFDVIEHPYFQRLRRINQLGLTYLVYPGAIHTRFQHSLGALHLMKTALQSLREKGILITDEEYLSAQLAILIHDIGHGPFSHTLEFSLLHHSNHEKVGEMITHKLNKDIDGRLDMAIAILQNNYPKKFIHQLVSSQLDVDRLDYLKRDSYFTGVNEGVIGTDRLIKMLNVHNDQIVVESKGIYSVEKFLVARRIMYWQVYLHKTVVGAENLLIEIIKRARHLAQQGLLSNGSEDLMFFLKNNISLKELDEKENISKFTRLDDYDILYSIKTWANDKDTVLKTLCQSLLHRKLPKVMIQKNKFDVSFIEDLKNNISKKLGIAIEDTNHLVYSGKTINRAYNQKSDKIFILEKDKKLTDIATASDNFNIKSLSKPVSKYYLCFPKDIVL
jgi:hypothetical protein